MKKLFMMLGFLTLLLSSLSARYIFDGKIIFSKHATNKDSLAYLIIEKAGGVLDTFATIDTSGTVTLHYSLLELFFEGNLWMLGDTLFFTDGGADTNWITLDANYLRFDGDNNIWFNNSVYFYNNIVGSNDIKLIQWAGWGLQLDYDDDDSLAFISYHNTDSLKSDTISHIMEWTGEGGYASSCFDGDSLNIGDEKWLKKLDFGNDAFGDAKTADTILITGATASDLYLVTAKDSLPAGYWTTVAKVGSLIVKSSAAEDDTPFIWWRFK